MSSRLQFGRFFIMFGQFVNYHLRLNGDFVEIIRSLAHIHRRNRDDHHWRQQLHDS